MFFILKILFEWFFLNFRTRNFGIKSSNCKNYFQNLIIKKFKKIKVFEEGYFEEEFIRSKSYLLYRKF